MLPQIAIDGILGENVITRANKLPVNSITYYCGSNAPANCPQYIAWGCYLMIKYSATNVSIFCWSNSNFACTYNLNPTNATTISWQNVH